MNTSKEKSKLKWHAVGAVVLWINAVISTFTLLKSSDDLGLRYIGIFTLLYSAFHAITLFLSLWGYSRKE